MSNVPAVQQAQAPALAESASDIQFRQLLRRMQVVVPVLARMPGLNASLIVKGDHAATVANIEAVGLALATYGIAVNAINVNQFDQIPPKSGQMVPRCQLRMGLASALCGHEIWDDPESNEEWARVYLRRSDTGRVFPVTYTIEQARASHALDFWFERWVGPEGSKSKETVVVGTSAEEAADRSRWPEWAKGDPKCNPAWHGYRGDQLKRRAFKRVINWGAPEIAAGLLTGGVGFPQPPPKATVTVAMDFDDEQPAIEAGGAIVVSDGIPEEAEQHDPVPSEVVERAQDEGRRVLRLRARIAAMPAHVRDELARRLGIDPAGLAYLAITNVDDAEDLVDDVTAWAFESRPITTEDACPSESATPTGRTEVVSAPGGDGSPTATPGRAPARPASPDASAEPSGATPSASERPRPLAQQIAMQAQAAGVDHHAVVSAVTSGAKTSAKEVDAEEGQLVLQAIAAIAAGEYGLGQGHDGAWIFVDRPATQQPLYAPGEEPFE